MKLVLDNGTEIVLTAMGSFIDGGENELEMVGYSTDHNDVLVVNLSLPRECADAIKARLGLDDGNDGAPPLGNDRVQNEPCIPTGH